MSSINNIREVFSMYKTFDLNLHFTSSLFYSAEEKKQKH